MNNLGISYLVTCCNETSTVEKLLHRLYSYLNDGDEVVIIYDTDCLVPDRKDYVDFLEKHIPVKFSYATKILGHGLNKNYSAHKNWGTEKTKNPWVFQLDGDEIPQETLLLNIHEIIDANPETELIYVPRINDFIGVTEVHAKQWGWRLTPCEACDGRPIVNWPDYQGRIYRNTPKLRWDRRLHEKIEGFDKFSVLPADTDLALYHDKTIETQLNTNKRYNEWFTAEENHGHNVFGQKPTGSK